MTKYTPGPWYLGTSTVYGYTDAGVTPIATLLSIPCIGGNDDEATTRGFEMENANGCLISAAPDLLENLRWILSAVEAEPDLCRLYSAHIAVAKAAIRKAEGKE